MIAPLNLLEEKVLASLADLQTEQPREVFSAAEVLDQLHAGVPVRISVDAVLGALRSLSEARLVTATGYGLLWRVAA